MHVQAYTDTYAVALFLYIMFTQREKLKSDEMIIHDVITAQIKIRGLLAGI